MLHPSPILNKGNARAVTKEENGKQQGGGGAALKQGNGEKGPEGENTGKMQI